MHRRMLSNIAKSPPKIKKSSASAIKNSRVAWQPGAKWKKDTGDRTRTYDLHHVKVLLYQLSYLRMGAMGRDGFEPSKSYDSRFTVCPL